MMTAIILLRLAIRLDTLATMKSERERVDLPLEATGASRCVRVNA